MGRVLALRPQPPGGRETVGPVGRQVERLLRAAIERKASDLHLDPQQGRTRCRMRIDGQFENGPQISETPHERIVARLKVLAGLPVYLRDQIQEGAIRRDNGVDLRLSILPTVAGEKVTIRIFDPATRCFRLQELGYRRELLERLEALCRGRDGSILICGPAGSGKTTTAYALLRRIREIRGDSVNICSVEDPVEFTLPGAHQVPVNRSRSLSFSAVLASLLRQDPEVLMIGEVRDTETAQIAIEAGMTGHLVVSSIHAGRAGEALTRLIDLGVDPRMLNSSVRAVVAQRLVRRLCRACDAQGCDSCRGTGYVGRFPVAELIEIDHSVTARVLAGDDANALNRLVFGNKGLPEQARREVAAGNTSREELVRVFGQSYGDDA